MYVEVFFESVGVAVAKSDLTRGREKVGLFCMAMGRQEGSSLTNLQAMLTSYLDDTP